MTLNDEAVRKDFNRRYDEVRKMAVRLVNGSSVSPVDKDDAVAFLTDHGLKAVQDYDRGVEYMVFTRMRSRLVDFIRSRARFNPEIPVGLDLAPVDDEAAADPADRIAEKDAARSQVHALFNHPRITDRQREVMFVLMQCDGDKDVAAEQLGLTRKAIDKTILRVRSAIFDGDQA